MKKLLFPFFVFICYSISGLHAQVLDENGWTANSTVRAVFQSGNTVYVGGDFTYFGPNTPCGVPVNTATGLPVQPYPDLNSLGRACIPDGTGGWYVGGSFSKAGTVVRNLLAHFKAGGTLDLSWDAKITGGAVYALALSGGILYMGGTFTTVGGQTRNNIAAVNAATGIVTAWNPNANGSLFCLAVGGSTIYAGGSFTSVGGQTRSKLATIDASTGTALSWNPNVSGNAVNSILINSATIYVGGTFTKVGTSTRNNIAALDARSASATSWNPNANATVSALAIKGTTVYAGGSFTYIGGRSRNYIAALDAAGTVTAATSWNPAAVGSNVLALAVSGSTIYAGGNFTTIGGEARYCAAALDLTTGLATAWSPNPSNTVYALANGGSTVYLAGAFISVGGQLRNRLAAFDVTTGKVTGWNPNVNGSVYALQVNGNTVYAGGNFTTVGSSARNKIAAIDATSGSATAFNPDADNMVSTLALKGNTIYAGGSFTTIGGQSRSYIAALDTAGGATVWNPGADGEVYALALKGSLVYAGGAFTSVGGQPRNRIAALDANGSATAWNPNSNGIISALAISRNIVYAGGNFTAIGGQTRNRIAALDTTGSATAWNPNSNSTVNALSVNGGTVYAGGDFISIGGQARNLLAALDAAGNATSWDPNINSPVLSLALSGNQLYVGGSFFSVSTAYRASFASFTVSASNTTDYFRSITSGDWDDFATWESSPVADFSSGVVSPATVAPDYNAATVTIFSGDTVSLNDERTIDQTVVNGILLVTPNTALTINNGTGTDVKVGAGGSLVLLSSAAGTARVSALPSGASISGDVTVERYYTSRRAWRLVTVPLGNANTAYEAWQNSKVYTPGIGTYITGPTGASGLDAGRTYSLKVHDFTSQQLVDIPGTNFSLSGPGAYSPTRGYFLFVRGDRNPANLSPPNSNATTLSATGNLLTGNQVFIGSGTAGAFALIGNPYASPVSFDNLQRLNVPRRFYVWDPSLNTVGGYVVFDDVNNTGTYTVTPSSSLTSHIQSGQAFFVQIASTGPATLTFTESSKSAEGNNAAFKTGISTACFLRTDLIVKNTNHTTTYADGVLTEFSNSYQAGAGIEDAVKLTNINENIAISTGGQSLALDRRPAVAGNDTIFLKLWNTTPKNYRLQFSPANFPPLLFATLQDGYLNTSTPVSVAEPTIVDFSVNADPASAKEDRFKIVFTSSATLPITYNKLNAIEKNAGIQLNWIVAAEKDTHSYIVEKSLDGVIFTPLAEVAAKNNNGSETNYNLFDINVVKGNNYYRIKALAISGAEKLSQMVSVNIGTLKNYITAYPNPVSGKAVTLQFVNQSQGAYLLQLYGKNGQRLLSKRLQHAGGSATQTIQLPAFLARGTYQLRISNGKTETVQQVVCN